LVSPCIHCCTSITSLIYFKYKDNLFIFSLAAVLAGLHYYGFFNVTDYTAPFFMPFSIRIGLCNTSMALVGLYVVTFQYFEFISDAGLSKHIAKTED
jgi:hypothetical protein